MDYYAGFWALGSWIWALASGLWAAVVRSVCLAPGSGTISTKWTLRFQGPGRGYWLCQFHINVTLLAGTFIFSKNCQNPKDSVSIFRARRVKMPKRHSKTNNNNNKGANLKCLVTQIQSLEPTKKPDAVVM